MRDNVKIFSIAIIMYFLSSCVAKNNGKDNPAKYYTYSSRAEYVQIKEYTAVENAELNGESFIYIGNDTIRYYMSNISDEIFYIVGTDTTLYDSILSHIFNINQTQCKVYRLISGSYAHDGQISTFISKNYGLLGSRSETWRSFTRRIYENDTALASILTDAVFEYDEWKCNNTIPIQ